MNANNDLKLVSTTVALVLFRFGVGSVVCTIAHQMFVGALRTNTHGYALILVCIQFEEVRAEFALDVGKVVDRILVFSAVPSQLLAKVSVIIPIPIATKSCESHRFSAAERPGSSMSRPKKLTIRKRPIRDFGGSPCSDVAIF